MKERKSISGNWRIFILYTLIVSVMIGSLSILSDKLPGVDGKISVFKFIISYLAVMLNSLPVWFILAMITGYLFARSVKEGALFGAICIVSSITLYFILGMFFSDIPISNSLTDWIFVFLNWYGASTVGGIIGGCTGFLLKKNRYVLIIVVLGLILQLYINGSRSWTDSVGIAQNVTFCLMIAGIMIYLWMIRGANKKQYAGNISK